MRLLKNECLFAIGIPLYSTNSILVGLLQPIVAVPAFMCADAFNKFLPFCTGFAAGCMIWMVVAEVLPDAFKVHNLYTCVIAFIWNSVHFYSTRMLEDNPVKVSLVDN